jgi:hypothetical protein
MEKFNRNLKHKNLNRQKVTSTTLFFEHVQINFKTIDLQINQHNVHPEDKAICMFFLYIFFYIYSNREYYK